MEKETIKERKCKLCNQILPKKSRSDRKTCSAGCRKNLSYFAKVGNTEYKKHEISKNGKKLFTSLEEIKNCLEDVQDLILYTNPIKTDKDKEKYKEQFKLHMVSYLEQIKKLADEKIDEVLGVEITEAQGILDELDDRDNDRNDNLYF